MGRGGDCCGLEEERTSASVKIGLKRAVRGDMVEG